MTKIYQAGECDCKTCKGGEPAPEGMFGGWRCMCPCLDAGGEGAAGGD